MHNAFYLDTFSLKALSGSYMLSHFITHEYIYIRWREIVSLYISRGGIKGFTVLLT